MLSRMYVHNFRCFVNFELRAEAKQLLFGPNGSGKSTLFEVLRRMQDFAIRGVPTDALFLGGTLTRWLDPNQEHSQSFELEVHGNGGTYQYAVLADYARGTPQRPRVTLAEIQPWLMRLLDRVDDEQGAQVILASHHPELLNQLAAQNGIGLDRPDGGPVRARPFQGKPDSPLAPAEIVARGWERV